ncbi:MAG: hypothetical protein MZV65_33065 [Chromatiales bacterium]|nr:hypothetical protein [Chromatiales bacterium]
MRGIEKPPAGMTWQEYAWRRLTEANPLPVGDGPRLPGALRDRAATATRSRTSSASTRSSTSSASGRSRTSSPSPSPRRRPARRWP